MTNIHTQRDKRDIDGYSTNLSKVRFAPPWGKLEGKQTVVFSLCMKKKNDMMFQRKNRGKQYSDYVAFIFIICVVFAEAPK